MSSDSDRVVCPFCEYSGRADHVKRHLKTLHTLLDVANIPLPNGCCYKPTERKPYVVASLKAEGSAKSQGVCLRCYEIIPHTEGGSRAMYASHCCKLARGQKSLPPIPDISFLKAEAASSTSAETVISMPDNINWDVVINDIRTDPVAAKVLDMKQTYEMTDEDGSSTTITRDSRETILKAIKCDGILKRCMRLEAVETSLEEAEEKLRVVGQELIDTKAQLEAMTIDRRDRIREAYQKIQILDARIAELTPSISITEHTN